MELILGFLILFIFGKLFLTVTSITFKILFGFIGFIGLLILLPISLALFTPILLALAIGVLILKIIF